MSAGSAHEHADHGSGIYMKVWFALIALTLLEVFLAYKGMALLTMLVILMGLSIFKSGLIIAYFMHLRFEKFSLFLTLIPMCVLCLILFGVFFPDAYRALEFRFPK